MECGVVHRWAAVHQSVARRMLSYLDHSGVSKVNTRELEHHVLAPNDLTFPEQKGQELCQTVEQMSERQELWATLVESKKSFQNYTPEEFQRQIFQELKELEEHNSKEVLVLLGQKHRLEDWRKKRERARILEGRELLVVESRSFSSLVAPGVDEEMSTPLRESIFGEGKRLVERWPGRRNGEAGGKKEPYPLPHVDPRIRTGSQTTGRLER